jgi:hypothetical protein
MKKAIILCVAVLVLAVTINMPHIDITGLFTKVASSFENIARAVVKQIFQAIANAL